MSTADRRLERLPVEIFERPDALALAVAHRIAALIRARAAEGRQCVLGLATGSTPVGVYRELVRLHREEQLSFRNVETFNLDEYWPMASDSIHSYHRFMQEHLFGLVDLDLSRTHVPPGTVPADADPGQRALRTKPPLTRPAASTFSCSGSARPATSASTSPAPAPTRALGS